ncbi:MAG: DUF3467 domain-containing protein [Myxococcota bacterium]
MPNDPSSPEAVSIDWSTEPTATYANGAHLLHTAREFAVVFTELAAFAGRGSDEPTEAKAKVAASVRLAPDVFFEFAAACASNWNSYAEQFGGPRAPRFQLQTPEPAGEK